VTTAAPAVFGRRGVSLFSDKTCSLLRLEHSQTVHLVHRDRAGSTLGLARHHLGASFRPHALSIPISRLPPATVNFGSRRY